MTERKSRNYYIEKLKKESTSKKVYVNGMTGGFETYTHYINLDGSVHEHDFVKTERIKQEKLTEENMLQKKALQTLLNESQSRMIKVIRKGILLMQPTNKMYEVITEADIYNTVWNSYGGYHWQLEDKVESIVETIKSNYYKEVTPIGYPNSRFYIRQL